MVFKPRTSHDIQMPRQVDPEGADSALLRAEVTDALHRAGYLDARRVSVVVHGRSVTLEGFVATRSEVDTAGEVAGRVAGVRRVDNRLNMQPALAS
jgi:osmotically-inducible protein OsmY